MMTTKLQTVNNIDTFIAALSGDTQRKLLCKPHTDLKKYICFLGVQEMFRMVHAATVTAWYKKATNERKNLSVANIASIVSDWESFDKITPDVSKALRSAYQIQSWGLSRCIYAVGFEHLLVNAKKQVLDDVWQCLAPSYSARDISASAIQHFVCPELQARRNKSITVDDWEKVELITLCENKWEHGGQTFKEPASGSDLAIVHCEIMISDNSLKQPELLPTKPLDSMLLPNSPTVVVSPLTTTVTDEREKQNEDNPKKRSSDKVEVLTKSRATKKRRVSVSEDETPTVQSISIAPVVTNTPAEYNAPPLPLPSTSSIFRNDMKKLVINVGTKGYRKIYPQSYTKSIGKAGLHKKGREALEKLFDENELTPLPSRFQAEMIELSNLTIESVIDSRRVELDVLDNLKHYRVLQFRNIGVKMHFVEVNWSLLQPRLKHNSLEEYLNWWIPCPNMRSIASNTFKILSRCPRLLNSKRISSDMIRQWHKAIWVEISSLSSSSQWFSSPIFA
jgi:hypothetical protein